MDVMIGFSPEVETGIVFPPYITLLRDWMKLLLHISTVMLFGYLTLLLIKVLTEYRKKREKSPLVLHLARKFGHGYVLELFQLRRSRFFRRHLSPNSRSIFPPGAIGPSPRQLAAAYLEHCIAYRREFVAKAKFHLSTDGLGEQQQQQQRDKAERFRPRNLNDLAVALVADLETVANYNAHWVPFVRAMVQTGLLKTIGKLMRDEYELEDDADRAILVLPKWAKFRLADMLDEVYRMIPRLAGSEEGRRAFQRVLNVHANPYPLYVSWFSLEEEEEEEEKKKKGASGEKSEEFEVMEELAKLKVDPVVPPNVNVASPSVASFAFIGRRRDAVLILLQLFLLVVDLVLYTAGAIVALYSYLIVAEHGMHKYATGSGLFDGFTDGLLQWVGLGGNSTDDAAAGSVITGMPSMAQ